MKLRSIILMCVVAAGCGWGLGMWRQGDRVIRAETEAEATPVHTKTARRSSRQSQFLRRDIEAVTRAMGEADANHEQLARSWATSDPEQFLAWILRTNPQPADEVMIAFFADWVLSDVEAAFEAALALPRQFEGKQQKVLSWMLSAALDDDWRVGLAWVERAQNMGASCGRGDWLQNPTLEMGEAIAQLPLGERDTPAQEILFHFAASFVEHDFEAAREWALALPPESARWALQEVLWEWAQRDLPGALDYLANEAPSSVRQTQDAILVAYAKKDPRAALAWVEANMGAPGASDHVFSIWMHHDQAGATEYVLGLEDPQQRAAYLESVAEARRNRGAAQEFFDWAEPLAVEDRVLALESVAERFTRYSNRTRGDFLGYVAALPEEEISNTLLERMQRGPMRHGESLPLTWAASLPGDRAVRATEIFVTAWAGRNLENAREAVDTLPAGQAREAAERILDRSEQE